MQKFLYNRRVDITCNDCITNIYECLVSEPQPPPTDRYCLGRKPLAMLELFLQPFDAAIPVPDNR